MGNVTGVLTPHTRHPPLSKRLWRVVWRARAHCERCLAHSGCQAQVLRGGQRGQQAGDERWRVLRQQLAERRGAVVVASGPKLADELPASVGVCMEQQRVGVGSSSVHVCQRMRLASSDVHRVDVSSRQQPTSS
jgi:hypothetical protein